MERTNSAMADDVAVAENSAVPEERNRRGTARMFESDLIERFSRVHPLVPAVLYLPVVGASIYAARALHDVPLPRLGLQVFVGYLLWTLCEYWLHRLVFHLPIVGPKTKRLNFLIHGVHHEYPWDESRLVFPAAASLGLCVLTYAGFRAVLGPAGMYGPFAGFVLGYVIYDEMHWYVHAKRPTSQFGRWLRREHFLHHFKDPSTRFGVSCPWLDYVFGTRPKKAERAADE
jgi:sterol desaturase/sphingolipid hydroxylase (fatty acid hydroxylase superfamily)